MKNLEKANMLLAEVREILAEYNWKVSNSLFYGLMESYPEDIINAAINHAALFIEDCGDYFIDNAGLIRIKLNCNWFVAAYDGCTVAEMHSDYSAMIMGY